MAAESPANGVSTTLSAAITNTATTCSLTSATGFTNAQYHCLISDGTNNEIVTVTALSGTTLTITRASETWGGSATAYAFSSGAKITIVATVQSVQNLINQTPATLTYQAAAPTSAAIAAGSITTLGTSSSVASGFYLINYQFTYQLTAANTAEAYLYAIVAAGTATITIIGPSNQQTTIPNAATTSNKWAVNFNTVIQVTAAGTLLFQALPQAAGTPSQIGYSIIKIA